MVAVATVALSVGVGGAASAAPLPNAWQQVGLGPAATDGDIEDVAIGRAGHSYMVVDHQLAVSGNGGQTWTPTAVPAHSVAAGAAGRVYALGSGGNTTFHEPLYVSDDDGATWSTQTTPLVSGRPAVGSQVLADPAVPGLIYVIEGGGNYDCIVAASGDSGATWRTPVVDPRTCRLVVGPGAGNAALSLDDELRTTADGGASWSTATAPVPSVSGRLAASPTALYFTAQDDSLFRSTDGGDTWDALGTGPGLIAGVDAADPASLFFYAPGGMVAGPVGGPYATVCACNSPVTAAAGAGFAIGDGTLWRRATAGGAFAEVPDAAVHTSNANAVGGAGGRLYSLGTGTALDVSTDQGASWAGHPLPAGLPPRAVVPVPGQVGSVYVVRQRGLIRTDDAGATWTPVTGSLPLTGREVYQVAASGSRVYAVLTGTSSLGSWVYATSDGGAHWTLIRRASNFTQEVAVDPAHPNLVFVWSADGLARSIDGGLHFSAAKQGPGAPVFDAVRPGWLYAIGHGRSWRSTDGGLTWRSFSKFHGLTVTRLVPDPKYGGVVYADAHLGGKGAIGRSTDAGASFSALGGTGASALNNPALLPDAVVADGPLNYSGGFQVTPSVFRYAIADTTPPGFALPPYPRLVEGTTLGANAVVREAWNGYDLDTGVASYAVQRADGTAPPVPVSLETPLTKERLFSVPVGVDTTIQVADTDGAGNASLFRGPRFSVQKIEDGSGVLPLGSHWIRSTNRDATAGHLRYATSPGSAFSLTFAGRAIAWVAPRSPQRGSAAVYVDGVKVKTVALGGAAQIKPRQVVFAKAWPARGTHTLKVVVLPRPAGQSTRVDVDALLLIP